MKPPEVDARRRALLAAGALASAAPLSGCSTPSLSRAEAEKRADFIDQSMSDLRAQALRDSEAQGQRGAAAALSLATLVPFADWDYYYVKGGPILWRPNPGQSFRPVEVPEGFVTDLTSVPRLFWQVARPEGRYAYAAVVHDYLYWAQTRSRAEADEIFKLAMEDSQVEGFRRWLLYQSVDKLGQGAWDRNRELKAAGERRALAKFPDDLSVSWSAWRSRPGSLR